MNNYILVTCLAAALGLLAWLTNSEEPMPEEVQYCEMVDIWQDTDGEYGWPDFKDNYDKVCNK